MSQYPFQRINALLEQLDYSNVYDYNTTLENTTDKYNYYTLKIDIQSVDLYITFRQSLKDKNDITPLLVYGFRRYGEDYINGFSLEFSSLEMENIRKIIKELTFNGRINYDNGNNR